MLQYIYFWIFLLIGSLASSSAKAQELQAAVHLHVDSTILVGTGLNTLDVHVENHHASDFEGYIELDLPNGLINIGDVRIPIRIVAGRSRFLSIKLRSAVPSVLEGKHLAVRMVSNKGLKLSQVPVRILVPEKRSITVQNNSELQYLRKVGDSVYVNIRVFNNGTTNEQIRLLFSSPDRMGDREFRSVMMTLSAGQDSLISVGFLVERYMLNLAQYTVRITGMYENNDVFGNSSILFPNISSVRNYQQMFNMDNHAHTYSNNFVDMQVHNNFNAPRMYFLSSEGNYRLWEGKLRYSLYANQIGDRIDKPNINNTFLEYQEKNKSITLGNIQESLEAPFYGRGLRMSLFDSVQYSQVSMGIVERSNDLLGFYNNGNPGMTAFAKVVLADQDPDRKRYEGQLYFDNNKMDSTQSVLWTNSFDLLRHGLVEKMQMKGFVAGGINYYTGDTEQFERIQPSTALGLQMMGSSRKWMYSSDNFFSTAYYTGNRRGALQLTQRINRMVGKTRYSFGGLYSSYNPQYIHARFNPYGNNLFRVEGDVRVPLSTFVSITMQPSYNSEGLDYYIQDDYINLSSHSWQLMTSANVRSKNYKHSLFMVTESGVISMHDDKETKFIFKSNLSYNYGSFGLVGFYQQGAFQVFEVLNSRLIGQPFGRRLSIGASYSGMALQKKLSWNTHIAANLTSAFGNSYTANINTSYRVLKNTLLTGTYQYNYTQSFLDYRYDFTNVRVGIRQNLRSYNLERPSVEIGDVKVFCFYDNNNNNYYDAGDEVAVGYGFMIGNIYFETDLKGKSLFKKIPYGEYVLFFPMRNGYQAVSRQVLIAGKSLEIAVPLQKVGTVRGTVILAYDPQLSLSVDLSLDRYTVIAQDQEGHLFEVRTKENGEFEFHLPQGKYTLYLKENLFPENIFIDEEKVREINVQLGKPIGIEPFLLKVRAKKIEVKRFGTQ